MTDAARFKDIYSRLDTLVTALSSKFRGLRAEVQQVRAQNDGILRILRDRNGGSSL